MLHPRLATLLVITSMAAGTAYAGEDVDPYRGRDGAAVARADIAAGKGARLYSHVANGRIPGFLTPGIAGCQQQPIQGDLAGFFMPLPEAGFQEGQPISSPWAFSARRFAKAYNRTMFQEKRGEIMLNCPNARLID